MKYYAIVFALGLLLGLFYTFMYRTLLVDPYKPLVSKKSMVDIKKEVTRSEEGYTKSFDSLKEKSTRLEVALSGTKRTLSEAKQQNQSLKKQVYHLIDRQNEQPLEHSEENNSCDSLIATVEYLMQSNSEKDSLYETVNINLEEQVKNKDSTIALKDEQYNMLKSSFNQSLSNQSALFDENKLLSKQVKKQKVKSKILSAALFIFSGVAINQLIRH